MVTQLCKLLNILLDGKNSDIIKIKCDKYQLFPAARGRVPVSTRLARQAKGTFPAEVQYAFQAAEQSSKNTISTSRAYADLRVANFLLFPDTPNRENTIHVWGRKGVYRNYWEGDHSGGLAETGRWGGGGICIF